MRATVPIVEAGVATADLAAALDEHHAEAPVTGETVLGEQPVARLEHVQRQHAVREQHRPEREHRERAGLSHPDLSWRATGAAPRSRAAWRAVSPSESTRDRFESGGGLGEAAQRAEDVGGLPALGRREARDAQAEPDGPYRRRRVRVWTNVFTRFPSILATIARVADRLEILGSEGCVTANRGEALGASGRVETGTAVERVEEHARVRTDQEVAGHADSGQRDARLGAPPRASARSG